MIQEAGFLFLGKGSNQGKGVMSWVSLRRNRKDKGPDACFGYGYLHKHAQPPQTGILPVPRWALHSPVLMRIVEADQVKEQDLDVEETRDNRGIVPHRHRYCGRTGTCCVAYNGHFDRWPARLSGLNAGRLPGYDFNRREDLDCKRRGLRG